MDAVMVVMEARALTSWQRFASHRIASHEAAGASGPGGAPDGSSPGMASGLGTRAASRS